jgi:Thioredoxin
MSQNQTIINVAIAGGVVLAFIGGFFGFQALQKTVAGSDDYKASANLLRPWNPVLGNKESRVKLVYLYDYMCSACQSNTENMTTIKAEYKDKVGFVYKVFVAAHPGSGDRMGKAALASSIQGKFDEFSEKLIRQTPEKPQAGLSQSELEKLAGELKLDVTKFGKDYNSLEVEKQHKSDQKDIANVNLPESIYEPGKIKPSGTPTTVILIDDKLTDMHWGSVIPLDDIKGQDGKDAKGLRSRLNDALAKVK